MYFFMLNVGVRWDNTDKVPIIIIIIIIDYAMTHSPTPSVLTCDSGGLKCTQMSQHLYTCSRSAKL